jgi:GAF domain-containing protein
VQQLTTREEDRAPKPTDEPKRHVPASPEHDPEELFARVKRDTARLFDVPLGFVSIVEFDEPFWKAHRAAVPDENDANGLLRDSAVCSQVADAVEPVVVENVSEDKRLAEDGFLKARGIQSYVAWPLRTDSGHAVGSLCVLDTKPREVSERTLGELRRIADQLIKSIEARALQTV